MNVPADVSAILDSDEAIEYECNDAQPVRIAKNVFSKTILYGALGLGYVVMSTFESLNLPLSFDGDYLRTGGIILLVLIALVGWRTFKATRTTRTYYVTDDKVVTFTESPAKTSVSYVTIDTIQNLELERGRIEQWFDAATLDISTTRGYDDTRLRAIEPDAEAGLIDEIRSRMSA